MHRLLCLIAILPGFAFAERPTAFRAFANVPPEAASRLAKIAACEGTPEPERWHFIVHDPTQDTGLRDYVVAEGRLVARNGVSQFAHGVRSEDMLPPGSVRIDSDYVSTLAQQYAIANGAAFASMNYELRKEPLDAQPVWKVTCLDAQDRTIGWLAIDATGGGVIARGGFQKTPLMRSMPPGEPLVDEDKPTDEPEGGFRPPPSPTPRKQARPSARISEPIEVRRAEPVERQRRIVIDPLRALRNLFDR